MNLIPKFVKNAFRRSSSSLENPNQDLLRLFGGLPSSAGVDVNENTAMSVSSVFACIRNIAEDCAKLPFDVYEQIEPRGRRRVTGHPMWRLMAVEPNPEMGPFEFRQALTANAALWGSGWAEIERSNGGLPIALWPIQSWRVQARRRANGQLYYLVDGKNELEPSQMMRIGGFGNNGIVGYMMARLAKDSFGLAMAAERFAATFFGNGTKPGGYLEVPGKLSEQAQRNLRDSIEGEHRGPDRAHRLMILEAGLKYTEGKINAQESQALESRQFQVEEISRWFRMPPHKIQSLSKATFNNIEHQGIEYVSDCLQPWLVKWEEESKRKLCQKTEAGVYGQHVVAALLRGDSVSRFTAHSKAVLSTIKTPNEIRSEENLNPIEGGDVLLVPANFTTLDGLKSNALNAKAEATQALAAAGIEEEEEGNDTDDVPGGEHDQATADSVVMSDLRPPPPGVVPPGQQPGLDSTFTGFRKLAKCGLVDSLRRVLHTESDKVIRAAKKPGEFRPFVDTFYPAHAGYVRAAIAPSLTLYAESIVEARGKSISPELRAKVQGQIEQVVARHVEASKADLTEADGLEQRVGLWVECRAESFVDAALDEVFELVKA